MHIKHWAFPTFCLYAALLTSSVNATTSWAVNGNGNWGTSSNWTAGLPDMFEDAGFGNFPSSSITINIDIPDATAAYLTFSNTTTTYTLTGSNPLYISNIGTSPSGNIISNETRNLIFGTPVDITNAGSYSITTTTGNIDFNAGLVKSPIMGRLGLSFATGGGIIRLEGDLSAFTLVSNFNLNEVAGEKGTLDLASPFTCDATLTAINGTFRFSAAASSGIISATPVGFSNLLTTTIEITDADSTLTLQGSMGQNGVSVLTPFIKTGAGTLVIESLNTAPPLSAFDTSVSD